MTRAPEWLPTAAADADADATPEFEFERDEAESGTAQHEHQDRSARLKKSPSAFRTISEVADDLHIPQHVLRFWETRFPQVKPLKRGGGRRYYRPDDIALLRRISDLLYIQGYTIKGVQRLLREGDGTLSGDLPPPDVADRGDEIDVAAGAAGSEGPEAHEALHPEVLHASIDPVQDAGGAVQLQELQEEVRRLRMALDSVLGGLLELRGHLPV
ncbi:MerR family transcriptional regulator [Lichenicola sp.]|uniref:MerR family transcriptional regulator n=1 Tax=Lichenicola sp. TaxID=2804529 RepID=UPI003AFF6F5D